MHLIPIPAHDADWLSLPAKSRVQAHLWMISLRGIPANLPVRGPGGIIDRLARENGTSAAKARETWYAWRKSGGDWRVLVNRNTLKSRNKTEGIHSPQFRAWGRAILDKYQRSEAQGIEEIIARIASGRESIPGLENWTGPGLPPGCSAPNLRRVLARTKAEKQQAQWGSRAAASVLPYVRSTRVGLSVGEQYMFDDVWHDHYVTVAGKPVRVLEFGAHDVASGCRFDWGHMPHVMLETGNRKSLDNEMFRQFLANILYKTGFHPAGCLLMMEHGTATLHDRFASVLHDRTGGLIRVGMGGLTGASNALMGGWAGRSAGNPRYKAMIECLHSLIHNVLSAFPGQSGRDRRQPETSDGMIAYQEKLAKIMPRLGNYAEKLKSPFLSFEEFTLILRDVYSIINHRQNHNLEGWRECGNYIREYALSEGVWTPENALPDPTRGTAELAAWEAIRALVVADSSRLRERLLSPSEVWSRGVSRLRRIPLDLYAYLLGDEKRRTVSVRKGYITLQDKSLSPEPRLYHARVIDLDSGRGRELSDDKYDIVFNPYNPASLIIMDARGGILGEAPLAVAAPRNDEDAVHRQMGLIASRKADLMRDYKIRNTEARDNAQALRDHNDAVIAEAMGWQTNEDKPALTAAQKRQLTRTANKAAAEDDINVFATVPVCRAAPQQQLPQEQVEPEFSVDFSDLLPK